ncbi:ATP-dependent helicase fft2 [Grifola frondosa]|uniref:DNA helicase n=1 Tax=Grifola frondosa TaxID=5627 RepID=A0A1C7LSD4_GRIFR|nr:ATP-dependent helicase fft2 [Grifola frondosa]
MFGDCYLLAVTWSSIVVLTRSSSAFSRILGLIWGDARAQCMHKIREGSRQCCVPDNSYPVQLVLPSPPPEHTSSDSFNIDSVDMSLGTNAAASRVITLDLIPPLHQKAALDHLKFKKVQRQQNSSLTHSPSPSASLWNAGPSVGEVPPAQSRDATLSSRYFSATPAPSGTILVPGSSPPHHDLPYRSNQVTYQFDSFGNATPTYNSASPRIQSSSSYGLDPLAAPSGFTTDSGVAHASFTRPWGANGRKISEMEDVSESGPPRKRVNLGLSSPGKDPIDFLSTPESPDIQRPGQRRRPPGAALSSASSDESLPDIKDVLNGPSKPRIVRGHRATPEQPSSSGPSQSETEDPRFTRFKLTQVEHRTERIRAAWIEAAGDVPKASNLLNDPSWKPIDPTPTPHVTNTHVETGRVKEIDDATKAQRQAVREKGKRSMIYQNRTTLDNKRPGGVRPTTPPPRTPPPKRIASPLTVSPDVAQPRARRLKRKVVDSDSEPEFVDSEEERGSQDRGSSDTAHEARALDYFNTSSAETLQELTGCTLEQANKIIELRPFSSTDDLNTKLAQGKKKAGPAGISSRIFEDSATLLEGYGRVDDILVKCERIGSQLKAEISTWTTHSGKGKQRAGTSSSRASSATGDEEGVLSLSQQEVSDGAKPKYYINTQPSFLSEVVQLKGYQMIGLNWLSLLYNKGLSCILADEMGLGKTIQVISFFAHLKQQGRKGPHLVVVPSSTLENWCREFDRFAPEIQVQTYYAGKNDRFRLRESLNSTIGAKVEGGWEVLITTYTLAAGDAVDCKFFRRIEWDTCVFDEGHVLKNFQSQRYQQLLRYKSNWRLLLTGTPLQNNLQELVSLMNFILPTHFAQSLDSLRAVFKTKGDSKVTLLAQERVSRAKKMMTPFVLRRRKDQVLQDLPKKSERIEWCEMTPLQRTIYNDALRRSRKTIFDAETTSAETSEAPVANGRTKQPKKKTRTNARTKDKIYLENSSNVLMDLRKAASHPMLFRRRFTNDILTAVTKLLLKEPDFRKRGAIFEYVKEDMEAMTDAELQVFLGSYKSTRKYLQEQECYMQAGKIKVLLQLLQRYQNEGRRMLIFSQFTQILDIIQKVLELKDVKFLVLTGSTPVDVRQTLVDEFNEDESIPVFLLSTKAGGMGINLTAASVVIMFDQDFNPHNDRQAQDRAYRIGQKRDVDVVKLITKGSIEEDMLQLGQTKLALDEAVAGEAGEEAESRVETEIKMSLLNVVRKKLEENADEKEQTGESDTVAEVESREKVEEDSS